MQAMHSCQDLSTAASLHFFLICKIKPKSTLLHGKAWQKSCYFPQNTRKAVSLYTFPQKLSQEFPTYPQIFAKVIHSVHNFCGLVDKSCALPL